jgi:hypothetical protein
MDVNGVRRSGVVVPVGRARAAYEAIVRQRVDPGILEIDKETNEFRTRVFPIPANGHKRVWMTTMQRVEPGEVKSALLRLSDLLSLLGAGKVTLRGS